MGNIFNSYFLKRKFLSGIAFDAVIFCEEATEFFGTLSLRFKQCCNLRKRVDDFFNSSILILLLLEVCRPLNCFLLHENMSFDPDMDRPILPCPLGLQFSNKFQSLPVVILQIYLLSFLAYIIVKNKKTYIKKSCVCCLSSM